MNEIDTLKPNSMITTPLILNQKVKETLPELMRKNEEYNSNRNSKVLRSNGLNMYPKEEEGF